MDTELVMVQYLQSAGGPQARGEREGDGDDDGQDQLPLRHLGDRLVGPEVQRTTQEGEVGCQYTDPVICI